MARNRPKAVDEAELFPTPKLVEAKQTGDEQRQERAKPRRNVHRTSLEIPRDLYEAMREIAFHERISMHTMMIEGLRRVVAEKGKKTA